MKLVDKDALVAEINKRIMDAPIDCYGHQRVWAYNDVKDILDTLEVKEETEWNEASIKPPFVETMDGNKYSEPVLCRDKFENYCIAQYVRWHTGYCGWYDSEEEVCITHWKILKHRKENKL